MRKVLTSFVVFTTLLWAMGFAAFVPVASAATLSAGDLIKASGKAVYYYAADGGRYTFPTQSTFMTWYADFSSVKTITDDELATIDLKGNVKVRPGTKLIKITTVPKVYAVGPEGMLYWVESEAAAKLLWGDNWASMVIDIPDGFFTNYTDSGETLDGTAYPEGALISPTSSADVYYVNADGSWSNVADETAFNLNKWNWNFVVQTALTMPSAGTAISTAMYHDVSQGGGGGTVVSGNLMVALSSMTPASKYVSKGAQNVVFAKYNLDINGSVTISQIVLQRKGLGYDADIDTVRLYNGATQIGTDQSFNTNTHQVTFKNLNWTLTSDAVLTVKANTNSSPSGTNDYFELVSVDAGTSSVAGLPVAGNAMEYSNLSVGELNVAAVSGTVNVISGATDLELGCWNFNTDSTEGFYLDSVKLTNIGSASSTEAMNFTLKQSSTTITDSAVASMASDGTVTFDMTANPYFIDKSKTKKLCVWGDIASGITVSKTLRFQVAEAKDVVAYGDSSAGEVLIEVGSAAFTAQSAKTNTITQGSATIAQDAAYAPTTGTILVKGVESNKMAAYKLTAGSDEGVRLTKLKITAAGTGIGSSDFSNWMLYKIVDGAEVEIPVSGSVSGLYVTFEDTNDGLLTVAKSESETFIVRADISTSFAGTESGVHVYVGAAQATGNDTLVKIKGLNSEEYVTDGVTTSGVATGDAQTFTGAADGDLVVSKATTSPTAETISKGTTAVNFLDLNLYATGEDMEVTELVLTGTSSGTIADDMSNVYITTEDGTRLGSTVTTPSSGEFSFSFSLDVPKDTNVKVKAYGDIPSGAASSTIHLDMDTAGTDITTNGVASGADITETGTAVGSTITVGGPSITAAMSSSPIASSYVVGASGVTVGRLILTAGTADDVKITSLKISTDDLTGITGASVASLDLTNLKLFKTGDHTTQYGTTKNFTDGVLAEDYALFAGITNLTVTKGQSESVDIVVDFFQDSGSATPDYFFGLENPTTSISGVGLLSNASLGASDINSGTTTAIETPAATVRAAGTLTVAKSADMPAAQQIVSGSTGIEIAKYKLTAAYEAMDITQLNLELSANFTADIANVKLYADGVIIGDAGGYVITDSSTYLKEINLPSGTFVVDADEDVVLTIKMDVNPKAQVTSSATSRYLGLELASGTYGLTNDGTYSMTVTGLSSGTAITDLDDSADDGYRSNAFTLHKGVLQVALNSNSPSGTATAGAGSEVLRLNLTAVGDTITVNDIEFVSGGTCTVAGTGVTYLKSLDGQTTYAEWTAAVSLTGAAPQDWNFSVDETNTAWNTTLEISAGETKTVKLTADTTGCTTNETLQVSLTAPAASNGTTAGIEWAASSSVNIDLATTSGLPVNGGSLVY